MTTLRPSRKVDAATEREVAAGDVDAATQREVTAAVASDVVAADGHGAGPDHAVVPRGWLGPFRVLRHRDYALVASGNFVNQLGMWARIVGIGWAAQELTDSPFLIGFAFGAQFLPSLFLAPIGGAMADRYDRRLVAIAGNIGMAIPTAAIAWLLYADSLTLALLIVLALVGGVLQSFTMPATQALVPHLVPYAEVQSAVALNSVLGNVSRFVGTAAVGALIAAYGTEIAFAFNTACFVVVVATWLAVRIRPDLPPQEPEPLGQRLLGGIAFARTNAVVRDLLLLMVVSAFLIVQQPLLPLVTKEMLGAGPSAYGLLNSVAGFGSIVGAMLAGRVSTDRGRRLGLGAAVLISGASLFAVSLVHSVPPAAVLQGTFGFAFFLLMTLTMTMITLSTPDRLLGRVLALYSMSVAGIVPINAMIAGVVASFLGVRLTIGVAGTLMLAYGIWFVIRRLPDIHLVIAERDA